MSFSGLYNGTITIIIIIIIIRYTSRARPTMMEWFNNHSCMIYHSLDYIYVLTRSIDS